EDLRALEPRVRDAVGKRLHRGKVDCNLRFQPTEAAAGALEMDEALVGRLLALAHRVEVMAHEMAGLRTIDLLRWPGVIRSAAIDNESLAEQAMQAFAKALEQMEDTRKREGARLRELMQQRLAAMAPLVNETRALLPEIIAAYRERLASRLGELRTQLDPARLEQEMVLFTSRADVAEELDRLATHLDEVRRVLDQSGPVGRRLDFLMQELNREANTLGSKATDIRVTNTSVELKVLIEQMREQVQNIE
ncbi:MAG: YicC family protein, partial [Candidatus Muproteobacteria bacterium RBG_16_64_10]